MNYLEELKEFAFLHAISQKMDKNSFEKILANIQTAEGAEKGSWSFEFKAVADQLSAEGMDADALQYYNLARFPFVNSDIRQIAHQRCVDSFAKLNKINHSGVERRTVSWDGQEVPFYFKSSGCPRAPLLIIIGGIVSIKEQWLRILVLAKKFKLNIALIEMPGVGENPCRYQADSYILFSKLMDALSGLANVNQTHVVAMSFGGNMAIQCALHDQRIRSIFTVGAPLYHFFTDKAAWQKVPSITKKILAHVCQCDERGLFDQVQGLGISSAQLSALTIPVHYISSQNDEIIPPAEKGYFKKFVTKQKCYEFKDVHGSPNHIKEIQLALVCYLLSHVRRKALLKGLVGAYLKFRLMRLKAS